MAGYEPLAQLGYGAYMLLKLPAPGLSGSSQDAGFAEVTLGNARWILVGQIAQRLFLDIQTQTYDVTPSGADWAEWRVGHRSFSIGFHLIFNPDLLNQSVEDLPMSRKASLLHQLQEGEIRSFKIYTKPADPGIGHAVFDFDAIIQRAYIMLPVGDIMTVDMTLQATGPLTASARVAGRNILQGLSNHDLEAGT